MAVTSVGWKEGRRGSGAGVQQLERDAPVIQGDWAAVAVQVEITAENREVGGGAKEHDGKHDLRFRGRALGVRGETGGVSRNRGDVDVVMVGGVNRIDYKSGCCQDANRRS